MVITPREYEQRGFGAVIELLCGKSSEQHSAVQWIQAPRVVTLSELAVPLFSRGG